MTANLLYMLNRLNRLLTNLLSNLKHTISPVCKTANVPLNLGLFFRIYLQITNVFPTIAQILRFTLCSCRPICLMHINTLIRLNLLLTVHSWKIMKTLKQNINYNFKFKQQHSHLYARWLCYLSFNLH